MAVLVGLDVGTSGTRAVAVNARGAVVAEATSVYETDSPRPGWSEQRPEDWWRAAKDVLAAVAAAARIEVAFSRGAEPSWTRPFEQQILGGDVAGER